MPSYSIGVYMGLISGSGSITRYQVEGALPANFMEEYPLRISRYAFKNFDENSLEERSIGWVNIMDIFDSRFAAMEYLKEPFIAMTLRVDERKVPQTALRQYCLEAEEKVKELEKLEFLPKSTRQEIKEHGRIQLLKRSIPVTRTYDMLWNTTSGVVIFGGVNNKVGDEFCELFLKTFDLQLSPLFPYAIAAKALEKDGVSSDVLDGLIPFHASRG
ncbi:conserved hypothetical protein [uncultured Desulfobacterium sp.]|uniref:Uncharacterized protein n=1 Tax=uncultured Desulfobacterium sp. TaxID=201089 RepID=A0A445MVV7_9BACT|nr:conserved hypothetical protein [uncultured Desulfobacterium sp.]